jgi:putative transposase
MRSKSETRRSHEWAWARTSHTARGQRGQAARRVAARADRRSAARGYGRGAARPHRVIESSATQTRARAVISRTPRRGICTVCFFEVRALRSSNSALFKWSGVSMQLALPFPRGRGGARRGAGRKKRPAHLRHTPHRARADHRRAHPVHVTLRASVRCLRRRQVVRTVLSALRDSNREWFRIAHYSVQGNHVHLIVEAESKASLASGMRGLAVRMARRINRLLFRRGRFWTDRWHSRALTSPRQVRNALVYVLQNHRKHASLRTRVNALLDPLSSAEWFDGFAQPLPIAFRSVGPPCVVLPKTWLLRIGWQRDGRIRFRESPKSA